MAIISLANPEDIEAIQAFYRQCDYGGGLSEKDQILIARLETEIVGAVRLCPETGFLVLRGMQVLAPFQHQGIGKQLLESCAEFMFGQSCYCIPWRYLSSFYQQAKFQEVLPHTVPTLLRERFSHYISKEMSVILMCRLPTDTN